MEQKSCVNKAKAELDKSISGLQENSRYLVALLTQSFLLLFFISSLKDDVLIRHCSILG